MKALCFLARVSAHKCSIGKAECEHFAVEVSRDGKEFFPVSVHRTNERARSALAELCSLEPNKPPFVMYFPTEDCEEKELDWTAFFKNQNNE